MESLRQLIEAQRARTVPTADRLPIHMPGSSVAAGPEDRGTAAAAVCPLCAGARFVRATSDPEDPRFGQPLPCECVRGEDDRARHQRLLRYSRLGTLARMTFETLVRQGRSDDPLLQRRYEEVVTVAERYAARPEGWLVITGVPGCGKTHLAAAVAARAIEQGRPALFFPVADLLDQLRASYDEDAALPYERLLDQLRNAPLVVLDDLDSYAETPWAREKFFQLVSHRFYAELPTVFTCARPPSDIDARLGSRLTDPAVSQVLTLQDPAPPAYFEIGGMTRERLRHHTFENFSPGGHGLRGRARDNLESAYRLVRSWAEEPAGWLVLSGGNGSGKTHLAAAAAGYRLERGDRVCFANVPDLLDELRATFAPGATGRFDDAFRRLLDVPLLVLDDLGAEQSSPWVNEKLYQLINHRHLAALPTIVTTNLRPLNEPTKRGGPRGAAEAKTFDRLEARVRSRLTDLGLSTAFDIEAPDYRAGAV